MSWKGKSGSQYHYGLDPVYLSAGLRKPRMGFTVAVGKEKLRGKDRATKRSDHRELVLAAIGGTDRFRSFLFFSSSYLKQLTT